MNTGSTSTTWVEKALIIPSVSSLSAAHHNTKASNLPAYETSAGVLIMGLFFQQALEEVTALQERTAELLITSLESTTMDSSQDLPQVCMSNNKEKLKRGKPLVNLIFSSLFSLEKHTKTQHLTLQQHQRVQSPEDPFLQLQSQELLNQTPQHHQLP